MNELMFRVANKTLNNIDQIEKSLDQISKMCNEAELDILNEASNNLLRAKRQIASIRGFD